MAVGLKFDTTQINNIQKQIERDLNSLNGESVKIGILGRDANLPYVRGQRLVQVAAINEFGLGTTPERSFIRSTFDENNKKWYNKIIRRMGRATLSSAFDRKILLFIGMLVKKDIRYKIQTMKNPRNAPRTIARKGFDNPLVETKTLYRRIKFERMRSAA